MRILALIFCLILTLGCETKERPPAKFKLGEIVNWKVTNKPVSITYSGYDIRYSDWVVYYTVHYEDNMGKIQTTDILEFELERIER